MTEIKDYTQGKITWCPGCLTADTDVHGNPSVRKITQYKVGDKVLGLDGQYHKITEVFNHIHKGLMFKVITELGSTTLTEEHPVLIAKRIKNEFEREWVEAKDIKKGDFAAYPKVLNKKSNYSDENYSYFEVKEIEKFKFEGDVYNFGVADVESYVTNNLTVHNCGDFALLNAVKGAFVELDIKPYNLAFTSGIGCSSKISYWTTSYGFSGLHGRGLQLALGAKLANKNLTVFSAAGDGDLFGEGVNHFIHTARKNVNITLIVHDNQVYGLTTGQKSPTSEKGFVTITSPKGVIEDPLNPLLLALSSGATFIARSFAGDLKHTTEMIAEGIKHKGFAFIDIFQPCVTYNYLNTYDYWKEKCYDVQKEKYDFTNKEEAFKKMNEWGKKIPVGILYKVDRPSYEELFKQTKVPLYKHDISNVKIDKLLEEFR